MSLDQKKKRGRPPKKKFNQEFHKKVKIAFKEKNTEQSTLVRNQTSIPFFQWLNKKIKIWTGKFRKTA